MAWDEANRLSQVTVLPSIVTGFAYGPDGTRVEKAATATTWRYPSGKRNRLREREYDELGIEHETFGVGKDLGKGNSDGKDVESRGIFGQRQSGRE